MAADHATLDSMQKPNAWLSEFRVRSCIGWRVTRTLVGALLQLLVVGSLLHQVQDGDGQAGVREGVRLGVNPTCTSCCGLQTSLE